MSNGNKLLELQDLEPSLVLQIMYTDSGIYDETVV